MTKAGKVDKKKIKHAMRDRVKVLESGNHAITKWLQKEDLNWLREEEARLTKKGWDVTIEKNNGKYRLFVVSKGSLPQEVYLNILSVTSKIYEGSALYEVRSWPDSRDIMADSEWFHIHTTTTNKDLGESTYARVIRA